MAGLLAAVLAEVFDHVTVVERDQLPPDAAPRRGVPQGRHVHVLLSRGAKAIDELLPGVLAELARDGGVTVANLNRMSLEFGGHLLCQDDAESDPTLPDPALPGGPRADAGEGAAAGDDARRPRRRGPPLGQGGRPGGGCDRRTALLARETRRLSADLVVAATGRSGRVGAWLKQHGYDEPAEEQLAIDLVYVSRLVRMDRALTRGWDAVVVSANPERPTGVAALRQEDDLWVVTVEGFAGHHPPTDPDAWLEMAARLAPPAFAPAIRGAVMVTDISAHRFPANLWRRFDKLDRFPEGLLVTGDAVCSFNPVYGQGMTVAALEALALRDSLRAGTRDLPTRFFKRAAKPVRLAWQSAVGGDLSMPREVVPGPRPLPVRAVNAYIDRYLEAAEHDAEMAWSFLKVTGFDEPTRALFTPTPCAVSPPLAGTARRSAHSWERRDRDAADRAAPTVPRREAAAPGRHPDPDLRSQPGAGQLEVVAGPEVAGVVVVRRPISRQQSHGLVRAGDDLGAVGRLHRGRTS